MLANFVSTSAGMLFGFVAHGLFTFSARTLTWRQAGLFLATNGVSMWLVQPAVIWVLLALLPSFTGVTLGAKLAAIAVSLVVNFVAYRYVVWPAAKRRSAAAARES